MNLMLSTVISTMYCADPVPPQGKAQAASAVSNIGFGLSPLNDGGRLPIVKSFQWTVCVTDVAVSGMDLFACAQANKSKIGRAHV